MTEFQIVFISLTVIAPVALWVASRRLRSEAYERLVSRSMAFVLLATYVGHVLINIFESTWSVQKTLPMQLCDWVLFAVAGALWYRWQTGFELGYFWGLAGTLQALFTPAIASDAGVFRLLGFFLAHALIVIGVLYLM